MYRLARLAALRLRALMYRLSGRFDCELPPYGEDVTRFVESGQLPCYAAARGLTYHTYQGPGRLEQERRLDLRTAYALDRGRLLARRVAVRENAAAGMDFDRIVAALSARHASPPQGLEDDGPWLRRLWRIPGAPLVTVFQYDTRTTASLSVCACEPLPAGRSALELLATWPEPPGAPGACGPALQDDA